MYLLDGYCAARYNEENAEGGVTVAKKRRLPEREAGVDLFRILGLLFVNGLHAFLYNGFYYEAQEGAAMWLANSFRWLFFGCNGMFMLLTGYLKTNKPWGKSYYKGLLTVLVGYVLTCVISYPVRYFLIGEKDSLSVWVERFFTFSNYAWYVEMYIGLILLSPLINFAMDGVKTPKNVWLLTGGIVLVTILPTITPAKLLPDWWTGMYPLGYYAVGAAIRRCKPKIPSAVGLLGAVLCAAGLGLASLLTTGGGKFNDGFSQGGYGGFWTALMVTCLFLGVYRLQAKPWLSKVLSFCAAGVFEGYILSRLWDVWVYKTVKFWHSPETYILIFLCVTLPVFLTSMLAGRLVHSISVQIVTPRKKH